MVRRAITRAGLQHPGGKAAVALVPQRKIAKWVAGLREIPCSGSDRRSDTLLEFYGFVERWARVL